MLDWLEFASHYGLIDIFFGIGIPAVLWSVIRKRFPKNYPYLHVSASILDNSVSIPPNHKNLPSIVFSLSNCGSSNFYIARAYFLPEKRDWRSLFFGKKTALKVHPDSDKIADKRNAFELKFATDNPSIFTHFETIIRPGHENKKRTWLALSEPLTNDLIQQRNCGTLYIEYATKDYHGVHKTII